MSISSNPPVTMDGRGMMFFIDMFAGCGELLHRESCTAVGRCFFYGPAGGFCKDAVVVMRSPNPYLFGKGRRFVFCRACFKFVFFRACGARRRKTRQRARRFDSPLPLKTLSSPTKEKAASPSLGCVPEARRRGLICFHR